MAESTSKISPKVPTTTPDTLDWKDQVMSGKRFRFGKNWRNFLRMLDDESIARAEESFHAMLVGASLSGKRFIDIGSGSGLSSLVARNAGAKVVSFDFDPECVACTEAIKEKYRPGDAEWAIMPGSVLDTVFLHNLEKFDVVYSWGVLHHTGSMWQAIENALQLVDQKGILFVSLYNDQGMKTAFWRQVKRLYCSNGLGRWLSCSIGFPSLMIQPLLACFLSRRNVFREYKKKRGMSFYSDCIDWLGGQPFEVAKPEEVLRFVRRFGFELANMTTTNGHGTNQFVFVRHSVSASSLSE